MYAPGNDRQSGGGVREIEEREREREKDKNRITTEGK